MNREELGDLEPAISKKALGVVFCPYEVISEPWLVAMGYAESAIRNGVKIKLNSRVDKAEFSNKTWTLSGKNMSEVHSKTIVNCAGLYGDQIEKLRDKSHAPGFTITPRKGQFVIFKTDQELPDKIIEQVATQFTKGVIVWKTVYGNLVIGPTAEPQESRTDRSNDPETI